MLKVLDKTLVENSRKWINLDERSYSLPEPPQAQRPEPRGHRRLGVPYVPKGLRARRGTVGASTLANTEDPNVSLTFSKTAS